MVGAYPLVTPLSEVTTPAQQGSIERARSRSSVGEVAEYSQQNMQTLTSGGSPGPWLFRELICRMVLRNFPYPLEGPRQCPVGLHSASRRLSRPLSNAHRSGDALRR